MNSRPPQIILKKGREKSVQKHHLWIFSGAIEGITRELSDGEVVEVFSNDGKYLATGHFEDGSICVRIFSFARVNVDKAFWKTLITNAVNKRISMQLFDFHITNAFRLIHAESDMMPGLIADYYNGAIVMQAHSVGMFNTIPLFAECFREIAFLYDTCRSRISVQWIIHAIMLVSQFRHRLSHQHQTYVKTCDPHVSGAAYVGTALCGRPK